MVLENKAKHCVVRTDFNDLIVPYNEISHISVLGKTSTPIMGLVPNRFFGKKDAPNAAQYINGVLDDNHESPSFSIFMRSGSRIEVNLVNFNGRYLLLKHTKESAFTEASKLGEQVSKLHAKIFKYLTR